MIEEYRFLTGGILHHQTAYMQLENYTLGGLVVVYGVLFGLGGNSNATKIPVIVWWAIVGVVLIAVIRCFGHYVMVRKLAVYIRKIEANAYQNGSLLGWENSHRGGIFGPWLLLTANVLSWGAVVAFTIAVALLETFRLALP
jgi:hypothetical protein